MAAAEQQQQTLHRSLTAEFAESGNCHTLLSLTRLDKLVPPGLGRKRAGPEAPAAAFEHDESRLALGRLAQPALRTCVPDGRELARAVLACCLIETGWPGPAVGHGIWTRWTRSRPDRAVSPPPRRGWLAAGVVLTLLRPGRQHPLRQLQAGGPQRSQLPLGLRIQRLERRARSLVASSGPRGSRAALAHRLRASCGRGSSSSARSTARDSSSLDHLIAHLLLLHMLRPQPADAVGSLQPDGRVLTVAGQFHQGLIHQGVELRRLPLAQRLPGHSQLRCNLARYPCP